MVTIKNLITRKKSVEIARKLKNEPRFIYVVEKRDEGRVYGTFVDRVRYNDQGYLVHVGYKEYLKNGGKQTQAAFSEYIYSQINDKVRTYLTR